MYHQQLQQQQQHQHMPIHPSVSIEGTTVIGALRASTNGAMYSLGDSILTNGALDNNKVASSSFTPSSRSYASMNSPMDGNQAKEGERAQREDAKSVTPPKGDVASPEKNSLPSAFIRVSRISCTACRKRKLRCSRTIPCSTCVRRGIAHTCYQDEGEEMNRAQNSNGHAHQHSAVEGHHRRGSEDYGQKQKRRRSETSASFSTVLQSPPEHERSMNNVDDVVVARSGDFGTHASSSSSSVEKTLIKARNQINALTALVRDSGASIDELTQEVYANRMKYASSARLTPPLNGVEGSGNDGLVVWQDVARFLPSVQECEERTDFFFNDLGIYITINQRSLIDRYWHDLLDGPGLERGKVAVLCTILAMADGTAPPLSGIRKHSMAEHDKWVKLMGDPLVTPYGEQVDNSFERCMALGLLAIYNLYMGRHDRLWECMGAVVRKGYIIGLFDERHKAWNGLSNVEKEYRRRLAWYMVSLERWQAFMRHLPFALHPDNIYLALPSFAPDDVVAKGQISTPHIVHTFPTTTSDGRLQTNTSANDGRVVKFVFIELIAVCHEFLSRFKSMAATQRYNRALQIDELLERTLIEGLINTGVDATELHSLRFLTAQTLDTCHKEKRVGVHLWVSSIFFLRCIITRRFLVDEHAPASLRFVSLTFAQGIVSTNPSLTRIVKEGRIPVQMTWSANHLLCAATTFAVVILGQDPYAGIDSDPVRSITGTARMNDFPQEQVHWLAENIFSTLECLSILVDRGNAAAVVAKRLLDSLCGSQEELRMMHRKRFSSYYEKDSTHSSTYRSHMPFSSLRCRESSFSSQSVSRESPYTAASPWARSPSTANSHASPQGTHTPASTSTHNHRFALPPMQPFPPLPPPQRTTTSNGQKSSPSATPIVGRLVNASALLDAVLMDPADLYFMDQTNTSDLLASLCSEKDTSSLGTTGELSRAPASASA